MKNSLWVALSWIPLVLGACTFGNGVNVAQEGSVDVYSQKVKTLEGEPAPLDRYRGKVALIVNTASKCGYTPQYEGLQTLFERYKDQGFVVLGFPSNDFMDQEPGTPGEIRAFCTENYGVTFPMFEKVKVKDGEGQSELYKLLGGAAGTLPSWNFGKYLVNQNGQVVKFFGTRTKPLDSEITSAIEALLSGKQSAMLAAGVAQAQTDGKPQDPAATGPLIQLEKAYADFPVDVPTAGKQLKLNGSALCEWGVLGFDLYRGALYAERPSKDANALMTVDQTLMVYLYFVRSLSSSQLQDAFRASAHYQVGKESPLESQLQTLLGWMRDVKKGDALAFVASPQGALKGFYNGQPLGTIESPDFTKLFVKLYLGNKPPTEALKKGMLGA